MQSLDHILIWFLVVFGGGTCFGLIIAPRLDNISRRRIYENGLEDGRRESKSTIALLKHLNFSLAEKSKSPDRKTK